MSERKYRIWMKETELLGAGYLCGSGQRSNQLSHRTEDKHEADVYDLYNAVLGWVEHERLGYPCEIIPTPAPEMVMQVLTGGGRGMSSKHEVPDKYTGGGCAMKAFIDLQQENTRLKELNREVTEILKDRKCRDCMFRDEEITDVIVCYLENCYLYVALQLLAKAEGKVG